MSSTSTDFASKDLAPVILVIVFPSRAHVSVDQFFIGNYVPSQKSSVQMSQGTRLVFPYIPAS